MQEAVAQLVAEVEWKACEVCELLSLSPPLTGGLLLVPFQSDNPLLASE